MVDSLSLKKTNPKPSVIQTARNCFSEVSVRQVQNSHGIWRRNKLVKMKSTTLLCFLKETFFFRPPIPVVDWGWVEVLVVMFVVLVGLLFNGGGVD